MPTTAPPSTSIVDAIALPDLEALQAIFQRANSADHDNFFAALVERLATALGVDEAFITEFIAPYSLRTLASWSAGEFAPNGEYDLRGTPCEEVITRGSCFYPSGLQQAYADSARGMESYLGVQLLARDGAVIGHVGVRSKSALPDDARPLTMLKIFASRAAAELVHLRMEEDLHNKVEELRELFEEAPIAYVHEALDSRFIRANRAAMRILGLTPEDVPTTYGKSLAPDTPSAQRVLNDAFESVGKGINTSDVVLELRRKNDGKPIWLQWWSNPDPTRTYMRTMFIDITDRVLMEREQAKLKAQNTYLQEELKSVHNFEEIVGASSGLLKVLEKVALVAPTDASVMITGETGTGKELIARAIHSASNRTDKPFIKINCAALPTSLVESELFGHERGAFSGAIQRRIGRFELAHTGTIFLDEIGEVPMDVQVKLLRVLQEHEFERIGSNQPIKTDVRVITATNRDLHKSIREGDFRADLYYRLNVFPLELPPLRDRQDDIALLAHFFVQKYAPRIGRRIEGIEPESLQRLMQYAWPGNIRELENVIERTLILSNTTTLHIDTEVLPGSATPISASSSHVTPSSDPAHIHRTLSHPIAGPVASPIASPVSSHAADDRSTSGRDLDSIQREHILTMLRDTNWVIEGSRGAAHRLGLKPGTLRHRMKKLGIARSTES